MSGRLLRAGIFGLLIFCLLGAPLLPVSAAVAPSSDSDRAGTIEAGNWHPLSFVYSLVQSMMGDDQGFQNGAMKSSTGDDKDEYPAEGDEGELPTNCLGPGVEPGEAC